MRTPLVVLGVSAVTVALVVGMAGRHFATRHELFDGNDRPRKCFVVTEKRIRYLDISRQGTDRETGRPCTPISPELVDPLARLDEKLRKGQPVEPVDPRAIPRFFSPTGLPLVWFRREESGAYAFFDSPAVDPITGTALKPVDREVVLDWQHQEEQRQAVARAEAASEAIKQEVMRQLERQQREQARLAQMRQLVTRCEHGSTQPVLGLSFVPRSNTSTLDALASEHLPAAIASVAPRSMLVVSRLFDPAFAADGYFERSFRGDLTPLRESGALGCTSFLTLGKVGTSCKPDASVQGVVGCKVTLDYRMFDLQGVLVASGTVSQIGPDINDEAAVVHATKLLAERELNKLIPPIGSSL